MIRWILLFLPLNASSQIAVVNGLGGSDASVKGVINSNPATFQKGQQLSVASPFLMTEFSTFSADIALDYHHGGWLFSAQRTGDRLWSQSYVSVARRQQIASHTNLGLSIDWTGMNINGTYPESFSSLSFKVGFWSMVTEKVSLGVVMHNPAQFKFSGTEAEKPPTRFEGGVAFRSSDRFLLSFEFDKTLRQRMVYRAGMRIRPVKNAIILLGWHSLPSVFSVGFGWKYKAWKIIVAGQHHPWLGFTPSISLVHVPVD